MYAPKYHRPNGDWDPWIRRKQKYNANEGVPQALMQAMAVGVPVISTPVGSIDELVRLAGDFPEIIRNAS